MIRRSVKHLLRQFGYELNRLTPTPLETLKKKLGRTPKLCVDVGAFRGHFSADIATRYPSTRVYSYEPNPQEYENLKSTTRFLPNVTPVNVALGAAAGRATLNITKGTASSSLLKPLPSKTPAWQDVLVSQSEIDVEVTTLDEELSRLQINHVDFLKIDAQGADYEVLAGATRSLSSGRISAIQVEVLIAPAYEYQASSSQVYLALNEYGFSLAGIYDTEYRNGELLQFDMLLTRF